MSGWQNVGIIHVIPLEDLQVHALTPNCACSPIAGIVVDSNVLQVTHNAFDGRDFDERDTAENAAIKESRKSAITLCRS